MGRSTPCASPTSDDAGCKLSFFSANYKQSCMEQDQRTYGIMEKNVKGMSLEDIDISSITENGDLSIQELGVTFNEVLHIRESHECLDNSNVMLNQDEFCTDTEMHSLSVDTNMLKGLSKCETMLFSELEMLQSRPLDIDVGEGSSRTVVHIEGSSKPTTAKLVSAMKGSRKQEGLLPKIKLSLKWAPDVYDPPSTSESHTVKGHRHHSESIKRDYYKHKHTRSKSSRGSGGDLKHAYRRSASNSINRRILRFRVVDDRSTINDRGRSDGEVLDFAVRTQELKCGSNFCMDSLSADHFPVANAS
ncbi:uncharacterized protein LOC103709078 [Phoenix dactylifera]|uniref:Uncharacterized protein LOC103709078 n=1 Tax=Phoenix dactylifera TaxID=42345 RepID=A0A8B7MV82_PHODC|nr:uncharacterized protein LOC103709078 [Phoenix dactylifera]